jgi:polyphosphate kinase
MTSDDEIGADASELFNFLTGYSKQNSYRKFLVAPVNMREHFLEFLERVIAHGEAGHIVFKLNSLVDGEIISTLYRASQAGVKIDLIVRGICCLRPGVKGVSENIRVLSIVGRFLEHSRIYYFHNKGEGDLYVGSADLMPRNIDRRVEVLFPIESPELRQDIIDNIVSAYLKDTVKGHWLQADGRYIEADSLEDETKPLFNSQEWFMNGRDNPVLPKD